jgi:GNS1/SUR4 family
MFTFRENLWMFWYKSYHGWFVESLDGAPLIAEIQEIWKTFPFERTPQDAILLLWPSTVALTLGFYLFLSKPLFRQLRQQALALSNQQQLYDRHLRMFIAVHNLVLAVFSLMVAVGSWKAVISHAAQFGLGAVYCDNAAMWQNFGQWAVVFYISKYYEFVDTWILILKGKPASFLQVYHHTGIALIMWCAVLSQSAWLIFVVLLNSVIHTFMYTYFFLKTILPNLTIKSAKYLTMAQIAQFLMGIACTFGVFYGGSSCASQSSRVALAMLHVYGYGLVGLFFAFAKRKYKEA